MKRKNRLLAMLMALAMVLAYMPAAAFAEGGISGDQTQVYQSGFMLFTLNGDGSAKLADHFRTEEALNSTSLTVPATLIIGGVGHPVTGIADDALIDLPKLTTVTVPPSIASIGTRALGYYENEAGTFLKVSGFTIIGTAGTPAQTYARANGFAFRDPDAEAAAAAEAVRNGKRVGSIPKVKITKPKAGKRSATIMWKQLSKKKAKKSKITHYEVWICRDKKFGIGNTSEHMIKKSKTGVRIKKMPKGTYFVKVRAVRKKGGVKYVGPWSKLQKVKVKK